MNFEDTILISMFCVRCRATGAICRCPTRHRCHMLSPLFDRLDITLRVASHIRPCASCAWIPKISQQAGILGSQERFFRSFVSW